MSRWSESRQLPRNFLVTSWRHARHARLPRNSSWRLPRNICYGEVTGKLVPVEFELYSFATETFRNDRVHCSIKQIREALSLSLYIRRVLVPRLLAFEYNWHLMINTLQQASADGTNRNMFSQCLPNG